MVLLSLSSVAFAAALYWNSDWNWAPVHIALPGPGLAVEDVFETTTSGTYRFEAEVPASSGGATEHLPPVSCHLEISIERKTSHFESLTLTTFRAGGGRSTIYYHADPTVKLPRGEYSIRVFNAGQSPPFGDRGALLTLTRFQGVTEFYLQGVLLRGLGWFCLAAGLAFAVVSEVRTRLRLM